MSTSVPVAGASVWTNIVVEGSLFLHCFPLDFVSPVQSSGRFSAIVFIDLSSVRVLSAANTILTESRRWTTRNVIIDIASASSVPWWKTIVTVPPIIRITARVPAVRPWRPIKVLLRRMLMKITTLITSDIRRSAAWPLKIYGRSSPIVLLVSAATTLLVVP